jgi:biopolymer transport protein ExbB/TolQ
MFDNGNNHWCIASRLAVLTLPSLFVAALGAGYAGFLPLHIELHTFVIIGFIFVVFITFVAHNAYVAACKVRAGFVAMEQALQEALENNALSIMGQTKSTLQVRDFMADYYKALRNDNFARIAPTVFPMLGILGTFIAIAVSMPDFTVKDLDALDREISVLLSGVGTAFYASIYGIMLSLVWIFFEKRGLSKIDTLTTDLERLYDKRIWKKAELVKHEHMQNALRDQEIVRTLKETFNIDFVREMNEQYMTHITALVQESTQQFKTVAHHIAKISQELRETVEGLDERKEGVNALSYMQDNIARFNATAEKLETLMRRMDEGVEHTFERFDEELAQSVERLGLMGRLLGEQNRILLETLEKLKAKED